MIVCRFARSKGMAGGGKGNGGEDYQDFVFHYQCSPSRFSMGAG
jgi:hypothetical protein